jgi:outer membrane murein-binding lipoprotein Lpp
MAFTVQDLGDLLALLRQHPEWREAVRREVLTEELLGLPAVVRRLAESQEQFSVDMRQLASEVDRLSAETRRLASEVDRLSAETRQLVADMRELARIVARLDGRIGNLEGWRYEQRFNARARLTEIVRRPVEVNLAELDTVLDARDSGRLSDSEWKQLLALDFLFRGTLGVERDAPEHLVVLEVSQVVDSRDVQRAHDRAAILARTGLASIAAVGGRRLTDDAAALAGELGVRTLVDSLAEE